QIFEQDGEPRFRALEVAVIDRLPRTAAVVATGGGSWIEARNRAAIQALGLSVWLDAPLDQMWARASGGGEPRPLLSDPAQAAQLLELRRPFYAMADLRIETAGLSLEAVVERVAAAVAAAVVERPGFS